MVVKINSFLKKLPSLSGIFSRLSRRFTGDEKGVTLVYVAISLPVILGFAGIGIDIAVWNLDKRESQAMADAVAMSAGVSVLRTGNYATINAAGLAGAVENGYSIAGLVASANGYVNAAGHSITINNPPSVGPRSAAVWGDPDGDGISGDTESIEVYVRRPAPVLFSSMVIKINTDPFLKSRTVINAINEPGENCMITLDPDGGITVSGTAQVNLDCGALSNGDVTINGGGCLDATQVLVVGTATGDGAPCSTAVPSITRPDPLRFLPEIERRTCDVNGATSVNNGKVKEMYPMPDGILVICGDIHINPGGTLELHPGVYVLKGVNLSVLGTLNTVGGAMIYITEDATNANSIAIAGGAIVNFDPLMPGLINLADNTACATNNNVFPPPPGGPTFMACTWIADLSDGSMPQGHELDEIYEGIAFFADRDTPAGVNYSFGGGATMSINGVIYLPGGDVTWSGGTASDVKAILADNVTVSGNADFGTIDGTILQSLLAFVFIKIIA